jgi:hypothetical protein
VDGQEPFQKWREEIVLREARPAALADLDYRALHRGTADAAPYCLVKYSKRDANP